MARRRIDRWVEEVPPPLLFFDTIFHFVTMSPPFLVIASFFFTPFIAFIFLLLLFFFFLLWPLCFYFFSFVLISHFFFLRPLILFYLFSRSVFVSKLKFISPFLYYLRPMVVRYTIVFYLFCKHRILLAEQSPQKQKLGSIEYSNYDFAKMKEKTKKQVISRVSLYLQSRMQVI